MGSLLPGGGARGVAQTDVVSGRAGVRTLDIVTDGRPEDEVHEIQSDLADLAAHFGEAVLAGLVRGDRVEVWPARVLDVSEVGGDGSPACSDGVWRIVIKF